MNYAMAYQQATAVARMELQKSIKGRRIAATYLLALGPVVLLGMRAFMARSVDESMLQLSQIYATLFQVFTLRMAVFFACVAVFSSLFSSDILEKTLHYYLLAPIRREVLVAGKFLAGLAQTSLVLIGSVVTSYVLMYLPSGTAAFDSFLFQQNGLNHLLWYIVVTFLGCVGYGAAFLLVGVIFKNPAPPALGILVWESINIFLPPTLQKISIVHYLQSLCPVPIPLGALAVITEPSSPWISIPGMLIVAAAILAFTGWKARRIEITYSTD